MIAKILLGLAGSAILAGSYVVEQGAVRVSVDENFPDGHHVHLIVPAAVVPLAVAFVPQREMSRAGHDAGRFMPAVRAACESLSRQADFELVNVQDGEQHVRIAKQGDLVVVDVEDESETVHVSVPLKTIDKIARDLQRSQPPA